MTVAEAAKATSTWSQFWSAWTHNPDGRGGISGHADLPHNLQKELDEARRTASKMQAERGRLHAELARGRDGASEPSRAAFPHAEATKRKQQSERDKEAYRQKHAWGHEKSVDWDRKRSKR